MVGDDNYAADYGPAARAEQQAREDAEGIRRMVEAQVGAAVEAERLRCARIAKRVADEMRAEVFGEIAARRILAAIQKPEVEG